MFKCKCDRKELFACKGCQRYDKFLNFMGWGTMTLIFGLLITFIIWSQEFSPLAKGLKELGL